MQKLKSHLYYATQCRTTLLDSHLRCPVVPGSGSRVDAERVLQHDRLLPPLLCPGPHRPAPRPRAYMDVDGPFMDYLVDLYAAGDPPRDLIGSIHNYLSTYPLTWTSLKKTVSAFIDALSADDAELLGFDLGTTVQDLNRMIDPQHWSFLHQTVPLAHASPCVQTLEQHCDQVRRRLAEQTMQIVPKPFGKCRVLLHLFSGRRRRGDLQFYLDAMMAQQHSFDLWVISLDIVIDPVFGDATRASTCDFWLTAIKDGYVIAMVAGPPCESWSRARGVSLDDVTRHGPRIIRDVNSLWGMESVTIRELQQLCIGNALLGFAVLAFLALIFADGVGLIEHPALPEDDAQAASIWRLPLLQMIMEFPNVDFVRFCQGLMGAHSAKPTHLLVLNLPHLILRLHAQRVRKDLPRAAAIGRSQAGVWRTSALKEYPPALCKALSEEIVCSIQTKRVSDFAPELSETFKAQCSSMIRTEFGEYIGRDFAGSG